MDRDDVVAKLLHLFLIISTTAFYGYTGLYIFKHTHSTLFAMLYFIGVEVLSFINVLFALICSGLIYFFV